MDLSTIPIAGWVTIALLAGWIPLDLILWATGRKTITQWVQGEKRRFAAIGFAAGCMMGHLFLGLTLAITLFASEARAQTWSSGFENGFAEWHGFRHKDSAGGQNDVALRPDGSPDWGSHYWIDCGPEWNAPEGDCIYHAEVWRAAVDPGIRGQGHRAYPVIHLAEQASGTPGAFCSSHYVWIDLGDMSSWPTWEADRELWWWSPSTLVTNENGWPNSAGIIWVVGREGVLAPGSSQQNATCSTMPFPQRRWVEFIECHDWRTNPIQFQVWLDGEPWCSGTDSFSGNLRAAHWGVYGHYGIPYLEQREDRHIVWELASWPSDLSAPPAEPPGVFDPVDTNPSDTDPSDENPSDPDPPVEPPPHPTPEPPVQRIEIGCAHCSAAGSVFAWALVLVLAYGLTRKRRRPR